MSAIRTQRDARRLLHGLRHIGAPVPMLADLTRAVVLSVGLDPIPPATPCAAGNAQRPPSPRCNSGRPLRGKGDPESECPTCRGELRVIVRSMRRGHQ